MSIRTTLEKNRVDPSTLKNLILRVSSGSWFMVFLVTQNLVIFLNHYFRDYGFPWDFAQGYYGMVAFWTSLVSQGVYPAWVPYHSMGMPFDVMLQTGAHYPPLWLFPLFKIEYTLHAAVVFQCLHILLGALGMFLFLRLSFQDHQYASLYALLGAFIFQFFGGFYSNAEHVDIIRAFSFAPWFFYFFSISSTSWSHLGWRIYFIPAAILLMLTGAYPGNIISSSLTISLYVFIQLIDHWRHKANIKFIAQLTTYILFMVILGFGMSIFHLGPAWLYKIYLLRSDEIGNFSAFGSLGIEHLPALFLSNSVVPGEISMTSTYITLPALIILTYIPVRIIKQHWPMVGVIMFSLLMATGPNSFFWFTLGKIIPPLQYSRFPSSDYRIFIAIGLIYFVTFSVKELIENGIPWNRFLFRTGIVFLWFLQGIYVSYPVLLSLPVYKAIFVCLITLFSFLYFFLYHKRYTHKVFVTIFSLMVLIAGDASRVLPDMIYTLVSQSTWQVPAFSQFYNTLNWPLEKDGELLTYRIIQNIPSSRPERIEKERYFDNSWEGFINGQYTLLSFKSSGMLKSSYAATEQPLYKNYMLREWMPLFFDLPNNSIAQKNIEIPLESIKSVFRSTKDSAIGSVIQTHYGINEIKYDISLDKPILMVENEIYFPGWTASLLFDHEISKIQALSVNHIFRAWILPAGNYSMLATFDFPNARIFNGISIAAMIIWISLYPLYRAKRKILEKILNSTLMPVTPS